MSPASRWEVRQAQPVSDRHASEGQPVDWNHHRESYLFLAWLTIQVCEPGDVATSFPSWRKGLPVNEANRKESRVRWRKGKTAKLSRKLDRASCHQPGSITLNLWIQQTKARKLSDLPVT